MHMPRPNKDRTINSEADLAKRISEERLRRGWTFDGLASRMTDAGCAIKGSAIYKIEKGSPPRRVTVDELVGFARVFETPIERLLAPQGDPEAQLEGTLKRLDRLGANMTEMMRHEVFTEMYDYIHVTERNPEVRDRRRELKVRSYTATADPASRPMTPYIDKLFQSLATDLLRRVDTPPVKKRSAKVPRKRGSGDAESRAAEES